MTTLTTQITDAAIKRHAPAEHVRQLHDRAQGVLYFRYHQSRDSGSWYLVRQKKWRKLGKWPEIGAGLMRKEVPKLLADADEAIETGQTLDDVLTWYRDRTEANRTLTKQRRADILSAIDNHLSPVRDLVERPLADVDRRALDTLLMTPLQQRLKPATVAKVFRILKTATKRAARLDVIGYDPLSAYQLADFLQARILPKPAALRAADLPDLFDAVHNARPRAAMLVLLMLLHGTRINETRLATWRQFDLVDGWWHIPGTHTKNRRPHRLPLTRQAVALLTWYRPHSPGDALFKAGQGVVSRQYAATLVRLISRREWSAHDLRKLARTIWADLGIEWWVAELLINHTPSKMDRTYIHTLVNEQSREALQQYHDWLETRSDTFASWVDRG